MVELGSENQRLLDKLRTAGDVHQRTIRSLESRIAAVSEDLEAAQTELRTVQSDYESYKVQETSNFFFLLLNASLDKYLFIRDSLEKNSFSLYAWFIFPWKQKWNNDLMLITYCGIFWRIDANQNLEL